VEYLAGEDVTTMTHEESIDGSGFPLAFKVRQGLRAGCVANAAPARDVYRVEARKIAGHQKELVVAEGDGGSAWRLTSDEGPNLKGTDLAPFPLAFWNAAMQGDYVNRLRHLAHVHGVALAIERIDLHNQYWFSGSFFKGTGQGTAEPVDVRIAVRSDAPPARVRPLLELALLASPVHAAFATPLADTFALYVNGRRVPVVRVAASRGADERDPYKAHAGAPRPLDGAADLQPIIERLPMDPAEGPPKVIPPEGRIPIPIGGYGAPVAPDGVYAATALPAGPGARFRIRCDERADAEGAPSALAHAAAGIAFCYMTQLTRYIEHRHHKVRAVRMVQTLPFTLSGDARAGTLRGGVEPVDTHVFLHAEEPDEVMQNLLEVAENTCYLHAALRSAIPGRVTATLNGAPLTSEEPSR
jgi:hypothetical protein